MAEQRSKFWVASSLAAVPALGLLWLFFSGNDPEAELVTRAPRSDAISVGTPTPGTRPLPRSPSASPEVAKAAAASAPAADPEQQREAQCAACQKSQCELFNTECLQDNAEVEDGEASGVERAELCRSVVECVHKTGCAKNGRENCYCGEGKSIDACLAAPGAGACRSVIEMAAESKDPRAVAERFIDPHWALGSAFRLLNCASEHCEICEATPADAI